MQLPLTNDFLSIVLNETPLLDVRAPVEFHKGAFANASNVPILDDEERTLVGTMYKKEGNAAAVKLAEELIKNEGKELRVAKWREFLKQNPTALLYCFRGGQRSGISQSWLHQAGMNVTRLKGGYKAFRNFLMDESLRISEKTNTLILGGRTGSGKTLLLPFIENSIDLEGVANHRGSTFGNFIDSQPSQIDFENNLAYKLIQFDAQNFTHLVIEHESHNIGRTFMPKPVYENLMRGKLIILETPIDKRVDITYHEYITVTLEDYAKSFGDEGVDRWAEDIFFRLEKIKKRLGDEFYRELKNIFENSLYLHKTRGEVEGYKEFIKKLLENYYDPMYDYQIQKSLIPIVFRGNAEEVLSFIKL